MTAKQDIKEMLIAACSMGMIGAGMIVGVLGVFIPFYDFTLLNLAEGIGVAVVGTLICAVGFMLFLPNPPRRETL